MRSKPIPFSDWAALFKRYLREGKGRRHHFPRDRDTNWSAVEFIESFSQLRGSDKSLNRKTFNDWCAGRSVPKGKNRTTLSKLFWPLTLAENAAERAAWSKAFADAEPPPRPSRSRTASAGSVSIADVVAAVSADKGREMLHLEGEICGNGYVSLAGALTDPFSEGTSIDFMSELQLTAGVDLAAGRIAREKVANFEALLDGCITGARSPYTSDGEVRHLSPSFITTVLNSLDSDPELGRMSASLKQQGRFDEHRLIECVLSHGRSALNVRTALAELKRFRSANAATPEVASFLNYRLAIGYRKLGLHAQAAFSGSEVRASAASGGRFRSIVLNLKHLDVPQLLYGTRDFHSDLSADTRQLSEAFEDMCGITANSVTPASVAEASELSIVASALLGMIQSRAVIAAKTEGEALSALTQVEEYGRSVQAVARGHGFSEAGASLFKHAYWEIARIAPFALLNGWVRVFDRIAKTYVEGFNLDDPLFRDAHQWFLKSQAGSSAEPIHVQMVMAMSVRQEVSGRDGGKVQDELLPAGAPAGAVHNVILGRAWAALQCNLGRPLSTALPTHTLPRMESRLMLDCVGMLLPN